MAVFSIGNHVVADRNTISAAIRGQRVAGMFVGAVAATLVGSLVRAVILDAHEEQLASERAKRREAEQETAAARKELKAAKEAAMRSNADRVRAEGRARRAEALGGLRMPGWW